MFSQSPSMIAKISQCSHFVLVQFRIDYKSLRKFRNVVGQPLEYFTKTPSHYKNFAVQSETPWSVSQPLRATMKIL